MQNQISEETMQLETEKISQKSGSSFGNILLPFLLLAAVISTGNSHHIIKINKLFSLVNKGENNWLLSVKVDLPFAEDSNPINELYKQTEEIISQLDSMLAPNSTVKIRTWLIPRNNTMRMQRKYPVLASGRISPVNADPFERFITAFYTARARKNKSSFMTTFMKVYHAPWSEITYITPLGTTPPLS